MKNKIKNIRLIISLLLLVGGITVRAQTTNTSPNAEQTNAVAIHTGHISFSLSPPQGWVLDLKPHSDSGYVAEIHPTEIIWKDSVTKMWVIVTPTEGKQASPLFGTDEQVKTLDESKALIRYARAGGFGSVIRLSDLTIPMADAYITNGDYFVEIVLQSDDAHFENAKKIFKQLVASYVKRAV
jgi:hypothetical protein